MILRKPYAFLIKYFKLIHVILSGLFIYLAYRTYHIYSFVQVYIKEGWSNSLNFTANDYVDGSMYLAILGALLFSLIILVLMKKKEKPIILYVVNIIAYLALFILFVFSYSIITDLETTMLDSRVVKLLSDFSVISLTIQVLVIIFALIRALGFDIKKFNFGEDIAELKIEMADNEEVEVNLSVDTDNILTSLRKQRREFKYVYQENRFIINILIIIVILVISAIVYLNIKVYNKVYKEDETFRMVNFNAYISDVYVTKEDYRRNKITNVNNSYVIVKLNVKNLSSVDNYFEYKNFRLLSGTQIYAPTIERADRLFDIGTAYNKDVISKGATKTYILIYLVDDRSLSNDLIIRYTNSITYNIGSTNARYKKIEVNPINIDTDNKQIREVLLKESLSFKESLLNDTKLTINSFNIQDYFVYSYEYCIKKVCKQYQSFIKADDASSYSKTILALDTSLIFPADITFKEIKTPFDFIAKLSTINYTINDVKKKHTVAIKNVTPSNYTGSTVYIEALNELKNASTISLVFNIRGKEYVYKIK